MNGNSDQNEQKAKGIVKRLLPIFKGHQTQVELIRKGVDNSPYPVILAGDFNAVPNSYEYYHLGKDLQDAFVKVGNGSMDFHQVFYISPKFNEIKSVFVQRHGIDELLEKFKEQYA